MWQEHIDLNFKQFNMFLRIPKEFINEHCLADGHKNIKTLKAHLFRDMDYQFNQTPKLMMKGWQFDCTHVSKIIHL